MRENKTRQEIVNYILNWNKKYPIDYWWRKKYNIPFGSARHRQADFIQMFFDYEEQNMMDKYIKSKEGEEDDEFNFEEQFKQSGVGKKMSQEQIDEDFDNIDLDRYSIGNETDKDG